jgi:hypothetical protein
MKKFIKCVLVVAVIVAAAICDYSFISESLQLRDTALLWIHGRVQGWIEIVLFCIFMDCFIAVPAWMIWYDIDDVFKD